MKKQVWAVPIENVHGGECFDFQGRVAKNLSRVKCYGCGFHDWSTEGGSDILLTPPFLYIFKRNCLKMKRGNQTRHKDTTFLYLACHFRLSSSYLSQTLFLSCPFSPSPSCPFPFSSPVLWNRHYQVSKFVKDNHTFFLHIDLNIFCLQSD